MSKREPKIRFRGFTDEWEQRKLGDEVQIIMGQSPSSENYTDNPSDHILVQGNADMKNGYVFPRLWTTQVTKQAVKGDLILSVRAPVGDIGKTDYDVVLGRGVSAIKGNEFIFQQLGKMKLDGYWAKYSTGSTFESINSNDIKTATIFSPNMKEQNKIGLLFKVMDNLITARQKQLDLLKEQKKGFLQKMFPKAGETVPEIRFAGFADDWKQRKLGDLASSFEYGLNASATEYDGENKYIRITDIDDSSHGFIQSGLTSPNTDLTAEENYLLREGDVLFARTGASVGKTYHYKVEDGHIYYAGFLIRARIRPDFDSEFVFQNTVTAKYENFICVTSQRSGQPGVNAQEYAKFELSVPSLSEQRKIGHFFEKIDNTITLHQQKVDILKELKRGFLQQMFI
ncbi:restriction endonuclease subunit S [Levilactobacillus brevis]|uniref:Restriction endonuclease subunit S n=1 Tax=Levilactobacillus brevis TaxID=1580 RepID=A0A2A3TUJ9_LEVBR|nr:restriction endonuclease subunit S [Levilactobacillus brevis]PBQ22520.1 restriction endonuclease subunit S [Levilactobacillus brevis]